MRISFLSHLFISGPTLWRYTFGALHLTCQGLPLLSKSADMVLQLCSLSDQQYRFLK